MPLYILKGGNRLMEINGKTITVGVFIKITGCKTKNDNGIYVVEAEYVTDDFCLRKVLITGELSNAKYNIFFLNKRALAKNKDMSVEVVEKGQLKQASADVRAYLNGVTASEKVYTFTPGNENSQYIKIVKAIYFTNRIYGLTGTYMIESKDDKRICFHLIGAKGEKISGNANNRYQGMDIIFSLKIDSFKKLSDEGYLEYLDRIESTKGEKKKVEKKQQKNAAELFSYLRHFY